MSALRSPRRSAPLFCGLPGLLVGLALCGSAAAQEAKVRTSLETHGTVWVGQQVTLVVEVLAPGYFSSAAAFDLPDPQGVLLMPPLGHPIVSSQTIDNTSYTVQRYELSAYPMRAGAQTIPAFRVRFGFKRAPLDADALAAAVTTTPLSVTAKTPPGAAHLGQVISARNLKIEDAWQPEPANGAVLAGAAFTRTITFTAPDVPGMLFPPFPADQIEGLGIYVKRQLLDQTDRGALRGARRDTITYVCQGPGAFTIPAARFAWFDLDAQQLRTQDLAAVTLNVIANPALATVNAPGAEADRRSVGRWILGSLAVAGLLVLLARWNATWRRMLAQAVAPFRPRHLQALNPTEQRQ